MAKKLSNRTKFSIFAFDWSSVSLLASFKYFLNPFLTPSKPHIDIIGEKVFGYTWL